MSTAQRILIVDDEPSVRMAIELALEKSNFEIVSVGSAELALDRMKDTTFDLLMVDKNMPGMSGVDLVRKLHDEHNPAWCVMITGFASAASAIETLNLGIRAYLEKPFDDIFRLVQQIEGLMAMKRTHDKLAHSTERLRALSKTAQKSKQTRVLLALPLASEAAWVRDTLKVRHSELVTVVDSEAAAIERASAEKPHLLITDLAITRRDFLEFIADLNARSPQTAVAVIASEKPAMAVVTRLIGAGIKAVIQRPLSEITFRSKMDAIFLRIRELEEPDSPAGAARKA